MSLPLQGVRVLEFVHMVMGPTCGTASRCSSAS